MENTNVTKDKILKVAKKLFAKKGFEGTTTREIVNEAGVNISLISYHFGGKENVLFALFDHFMDEFAQKVPANVNMDLTQELKSTLIHIIKLRFIEPELVSILHHEIILNSGRADKIRALLLPVWTRVKSLLEEGKAQGVFYFENIENAFAFTMSVAIFPRYNIYFQERIYDQPEDIENIANELMGFILKGLQIEMYQ
ncbi:TetR/AcrR family transcriptional regulator [Anaerocolumna sp. AGMB13020]|uniref:TetR/AcrR family transcriptional regulator n=1 Tax=Anaerocolumna sp. AGMB13020 TaxID=3081750 RepID=UPI002954BE5D|nr:TetR/AcrR family transcriptional regulator [Anaerocolumna sp. AGMB13020]WOO37964.1 TetR/AcrR family transcriptional regulator [Anaerocolumna sp. AGMB13020]